MLKKETDVPGSHFVGKGEAVGRGIEMQVPAHAVVVKGKTGAGEANAVSGIDVVPSADVEKAAEVLAGLVVAKIYGAVHDNSRPNAALVKLTGDNAIDDFNGG